jgi:hypothetical protein
MANSCEHGNEPSGFMKHWSILSDSAMLVSQEDLGSTGLVALPDLSTSLHVH